jgi:ATP-dependent RNA helicase HelY
MDSPAERYAASRRRAADVARSPALAEFAAGLDFALDDFQRDACEALEAGGGVLVCAPTGAGKTVVGEFAVHLALRAGASGARRKCFYTTPIKALSNQKFHDLSERYGADKVGLLTGDNAINGDAQVVVMTTEVLRNMLYANSSTLDGLGFVVMDEVHYLADRFRGAVWEEVIIHLPASVTLVSLSATVSNAEEFADWLTTVRGETGVIVSEHRPVPLWQHMLVGKRMFDLFHDASAAAKHDVHPELLRYTREMTRRIDGDDRPGRGRNRRWPLPIRADIIDRLDRDGLLPAIYFIFSRAGCDAAVVQCLQSGLRLTTPDERAEIRQLAQERTAHIPSDDLHVLGYWEWLDGLERGLAAHHAGLLPTFKEIVEELFVRGLVKAVFATETLALGINMPARCVVLERLVKFNGEAHVDLTAGEYTQLTGRAGRRGIDIEGHAVVVWSPDVDPRHVAGLASTRTYPLRSSFRPSYNMAVNLVASVGKVRARALLESSFAQFQADRSVVGIAKQVQKNNETSRLYEAEMACDKGDFESYFALRSRISELEKAAARQGVAQRRAVALAALEKLKVGDVIRVPSGKRSGLAVVLDPGAAAFTEPRPLVLTEDRWAGRVTITDFTQPVTALGRVRVPRNFNPRSASERRDLAASLRAVRIEGDVRRPSRGKRGTEDEREIEYLRHEMRKHPCHACPEREDHARWAERYHKLERDTRTLQRRIEQRTNTIARQFDRVCDVLTALHYLEDDKVTETGARLMRIYTDMDLVAAEALRHGLWDDLSASELAAALSALVFEARRADDASAPRLPGGRVKEVLAETVSLWADLDALERENKLDFLREPDLGFAWAAYRWAEGANLDEVLSETDLAAGDFVRWMKQLLDLTDQVADAAGDSPLRKAARLTAGALRRGVVAYSSVAD